MCGLLYVGVPNIKLFLVARRLTWKGSENAIRPSLTCSLCKLKGRNVWQSDMAAHLDVSLVSGNTRVQDVEQLEDSLE